MRSRFGQRFARPGALSLRRFSENLPAVRDVYSRKMGLVSAYDQTRPLNDHRVNIMRSADFVERKPTVKSKKYKNFADMEFEEYVRVLEATHKVVGTRSHVLFPSRRLYSHGSACVVKHGSDQSYLVGAYHTVYPFVDLAMQDGMLKDLRCEEGEASFKLTSVDCFCAGADDAHPLTVVWHDLQRDICVLASNTRLDAPALELAPWPEEANDVPFVLLVGFHARTTATADTFSHNISTETIESVMGSADQFSRSMSCLSQKYVDESRAKPNDANAYLRAGLAARHHKKGWIEVQNGCLEGYSGGPVVTKPATVSGILVEGYDGSNNLVSPFVVNDPIFDVLNDLN